MAEESQRTGRGAIFDALLGVIGAAVLFAMMILTTTDVVLRYVFNAPLRGAFELTELMLVVLIFSGLPLVSHNDKHVTMDVIDRFLTERLRKGLAAVIHLIFSAALIAIGWLVWGKAGRLAQTGDTTADLHIMLAPFVYLMSVLIVLTAIIHIMKAFRGELGQGGGGNLV